MNILILGATSSIARAIACEFAAQGHHLHLASRDEEELARLATDLKVRYQTHVTHDIFDAEKLESHTDFWQHTLQTMGHIDGLVLAFGCSFPADDYPTINKMITCNLTGAINILNICAHYFSRQKKGFIIGISSVAGDRGRQKNYIYGATKAGLTTYLQGLRNQLFSSNVRVITIKPGFVDTAMTFGLPNLFLVAEPRYVAKKIIKSLSRSNDVIYVPWFWRYMMGIIRLIPERIFKRLNL